MSSAEQQRKAIEALHAQTPIGQECESLKAALGNIRDKETVVRSASRILGCGPQAVDGKVRIGNFEFEFDADEDLTSLSNWTGGIVIRIVMRTRR